MAAGEGITLTLRTRPNSVTEIKSRQDVDILRCRVTSLTLWKVMISISAVFLAKSHKLRWTCTTSCSPGVSFTQTRRLFSVRTFASKNKIPRLQSLHKRFHNVVQVTLCRSVERILRCGKPSWDKILLLRPKRREYKVSKWEKWFGTKQECCWRVILVGLRGYTVKGSVWRSTEWRGGNTRWSSYALRLVCRKTGSIGARSRGKLISHCLLGENFFLQMVVYKTNFVSHYFPVEYFLWCFPG